MAESMFSSVAPTPEEILKKRREAYRAQLKGMSGAEKAGAGIGALFSRFFPDGELERAKKINTIFSETQQEFLGEPAADQGGQEVQDTGSDGTIAPTKTAEMSRYERDRSLIIDSANMYDVLADRLASQGYSREAEAAQRDAEAARMKAYELDKAYLYNEYLKAQTSAKGATKERDIPALGKTQEANIKGIIEGDDTLRQLVGNYSIAETIGRFGAELGSIVGLTESPQDAPMTEDQLISLIHAYSQKNNVSTFEAAEIIKGQLLGSQGGVSQPTAPPVTEPAQPTAPIQPQATSISLQPGEVVVDQTWLQNHPVIAQAYPDLQPGQIINLRTREIRNP
jgi:hypothetical protein